MRESVHRTLRALALGAVLAAVPVAAHGAESEPGPQRAGVAVAVEITPLPAAPTGPPSADFGVAPLQLPPATGPAEGPRPPATAELERTGSAVVPALTAAAALAAAGGTVLLHGRRAAELARTR